MRCTLIVTQRQRTSRAGGLHACTPALPMTQTGASLVEKVATDAGRQESLARGEAAAAAVRDGC
jgi:hypothetical protein